MDSSLTTSLPAVLPAATALPRVSLTAAAPRLSVVVVNYRNWSDTSKLVKQLQGTLAVGNGTAEVVVVDNHSPWHPLVPRLRRMEGVSLRRWRRNRGFARAVNEGCRLSSGDWLLLLNPDMTLAPEFLDCAMHHAEELLGKDDATGIIGFGLRDPGGSAQASVGPFPSLGGTLGRLLLPRRWRKYYLRVKDRQQRVDWVTGCCLMVRRRCWEDLGGFDPTFFLYYEDVDLCHRARDRGWHVWYDPTLSAVHHHPLHSRGVPPHLRLITRHALLTYAAKHWAGWQFQALAGIIRLEAWLRKRSARARQDTAAARTFRLLGRVARDLAAGRTAAARAQLLRVVHRHEDQSRAASAIGGHPQP
jgi:GT2 family glycosyltransferase